MTGGGRPRGREGARAGRRDPEGTGARAPARWRTALRRWRRDPAAALVLGVVFLVSAVGQALLQRHLGDDSVVVTAVLSVLGSLFLAVAIVVAIVVAARRDDRRRRDDPPGPAAPG